jgi:abortive infection bacteriophage resistance protein
MDITDTTAATAWLKRIGYYRLSGYWYPFRRSDFGQSRCSGDQAIPNPMVNRPPVIVEDDFRPGTTFQHVTDLYVFDKRLRLLFLDAIERVEIAMRVNIALLMGIRDPWAHLDANQLHGNFSTKIDPSTGKTQHRKWVEKLDCIFARSQDEFAKHFKAKYPGDDPPIWIAIELWDFGMLSVFLNGMKIADREQLAWKYGLPRIDLLTTWARNINHVRNICAHHSRLWNRSPADQISPPKSGEIPELDHLALDRTAQTRIYATAAVLQFLLRTINPTTSWGRRLVSHCDNFPGQPPINLAQAGFPAGWKQLVLWK